MPASKLRTIIFDIGRVLVRIDVSLAMKGLAQNMSLSSEEIWSAIQNDPGWPDWQEGRLSARDWHLRLAKRFGTTLDFEQFIKIWNLALDPRPVLPDALLEALSRRYRLAVLSNTDPIHVVHLESTYDFFRFFPVRIYSCTVGASKPSALIYQKALQNCKTTADQALYIDDIPAYVQVARQLGMKGIVFESAEQLWADLRVLNVRLDLKPALSGK